MSLSAKAHACRAAAALCAMVLVSGPPAGRIPRQTLFIPAAQAQTPPAPSSVTADGIVLRSVSVDLPVSERMFPGGDAAEAINNNCLTCHSAGMVLTQPRLTAAAWGDEVAKMRGVYKAPVAAEDVPAIVAYLSRLTPGQ